MNNLIRKLEFEGNEAENKIKQKVNTEKEKDGVLSDLQKQQNSFKSMTNILNAYENVNEENHPIDHEDESFLLLLT